MTPVRILHVASHQINVGDGTLIQVIRDRLNQIADRPIHYEALNIVDFHAADGAVAFEAIPRDRHDLILVGGGGVIDGKRSRNRSGMAFPYDGQAIRRSPVPLAYVGLGYNLFPGEQLHYRAQLADVLEACRERNFPFSVRNDGSLQRLRAEVGSAADQVVEIPDPGFFVQVDPTYRCPQQLGHRPTILLQVAGDNLKNRLADGGTRLPWPSLPRNHEKQFVREMAAYIRWLVGELQAEVVLAPHISRDVSLTGKILDRLPPKIVRPHVRMLGITHPSRAAQFFQAYAEADLVVGMRGHCVICAVGLRVPCLAIATHDKVSGFMDNCGLGAWSLAWSSRVGAVLREATCQLLADPESQLHARDHATSDFNTRFHTFMLRVWETANAFPQRRRSA